MAERWDHRQYGTEADPIRQSDLNEVAGSYSCSKRLRYRKDADLSETEQPKERTSFKAAGGTAIHETIRTYLTGAKTQPRILAGELPSDESIAVVLIREMERAAAGKCVDWYGVSPKTWGAEALAMVKGALQDVGERAESIVASEVDFLAPIDCDGKIYWLRGTMDLVYIAKLTRHLVLADWKTGQQKLPQVVLDHGYQTGIYAHALAHGTLTRGEESWQVGRFPDEIYIVHLRDHIPYQKASSKEAKRPEECAFWNVAKGTKVKLAKGDKRGPAWYAANRTEDDVARLKHSIRKIVSGVRLGVLYEHVGDHCEKCTFAGSCLTDGHAVHGDEAERLERALAGIDLEGLDEDVAA